MKDILEALIELYNWKQLGSELGFTSFHLASIENEHGICSHRACKKQLIWDWMTRCENCTRQSLKYALERMGAECLSDYEHPEQLAMVHAHVP